MAADPLTTRVARRVEPKAHRLRTAPTHARLRALALTQRRQRPGTANVHGLAVDYTDALELLVAYRQIFRARAYHFDATGRAPRVIDGGGHIGLAALYFARCHPDARLTVFEPDERLCAVIETNLGRAGVEADVVRAGLAEHDAGMAFAATGGDDGRLRSGADGPSVPTTRLSPYLADPVDFLKLNIEGQELAVVREAGDALRNVRELVIEYHGWADGSQDLGPLLCELDARGFRYVVNHLDDRLNPVAVPPFGRRAGGTWWALVHGVRIGGAGRTPPT